MDVIACEPLVLVGGNSPSPPQQQVSDPEPVPSTKAVGVGAVTRQEKDSPVISPSPSSLGCVPSIAATSPTTILDPPPPPRSPSLHMQITNRPLRVTNPDLEQEEKEMQDSDSTAVTPSQRTGNETEKAKELVVINGEEDSIRRPLMVSAPPSQVKNGEKEGGSVVVHAKEQDSGAVNRYEERRPPMVSAPPSFPSTPPNGHASPDSTPTPNEPSAENPVPTPQSTSAVHPKEQDSGAVNRYDEVKETTPPMVSAPPSFSSPTNTPATPKSLRSILKVDERLVDARGVTVPRRKREESREEAVPKSPRAALASAPPSLSSPTSSPSQPQSPSSASPIKVAPRAAHRRLTSLYFPFGIVPTTPDTSWRPLPPVLDVGDVSRNRRRPGVTRSWSGSIAPPTHSFDVIDIPGRKRMSLPPQKSSGLDRHQRSQSIPASQRIPMHFLMSPSGLLLRSPSLRSPSSVSLQSPMSQFRCQSTCSLHPPGFQLRSPSNISLHSPSNNLRSPCNVSLHSPGSNLRSPSNAEEGGESIHAHHAPTNLSQRPPLSPLISPSAVSLLPPGAAPASPVGPLPIFGRDLTELDLLVARINDPETKNGAKSEALLALRSSSRSRCPCNHTNARTQPSRKSRQSCKVKIDKRW
ncbi:hypothetical protein FRC03_000420 [Tulasnella sp. 419]|nr:hypothetical protein FRC03_000420 [Tulasnella sp. 419]